MVLFALFRLNVELQVVLVQVELQPISGRVDRASATEAVDTGSIPG